MTTHSPKMAIALFGLLEKMLRGKYL